jgi:endonuclease/exonuclease/phosphatase family metal-dependent hydrolase
MSRLGDLERLHRDQPGALIIWAGDFNQSLEAPNRTGTTAGRALLEQALERLSFTAWNRSASHALPELCAIDLICGPRDLKVTNIERIDPTIDGRRVSDHAGYVVELAPSC